MDLVWVFDNGVSEVPSGPYSSKQAAEKDIEVMMARNSAGEQFDCSEPYQMERSKLKQLVYDYMDESEVNESMSDKDKKEFYARLQTEKVHFQYRKVSTGEMRKAYGTLIPEELPKPAHKSDTKQEARDKMKAKKFPDDSVFYYDLDAKGFRSFKMKNFDKYLDEK